MYYRLTYISSSDKSQAGDSMLNGNKPLNIGHGVGCDLRLSGFEQYEPEVFASILPHPDGDGWYVVKRTDSYNCLLNGESVHIAGTLDNGDILSFADPESNVALAELKFEIFDDGEYDTSSGIVYKKHETNKSYLIGILTVAIVALGVAAYGLSAHHRSLRDENLRVYHPSIYHITTDSVYLLCDTIVEGQHQTIALDSIELDEVAEGTAFLTSDSLFVTARHCIEPWINDEEWDGVSSKSKMSPEVRLATKAETGNRFAGYEKYFLRAHCVISKGFERYDYYSTDFSMNKSRDMVMRLGNDEEVIYWRTIFPIAHRRDMELGDFAYIKHEKLSNGASYPQTKMAEWEDIKQFVNQNNHEIAVLGYPLSDNHTEAVTETWGNLMAFEYNENLGTPVGCIQLSADINPGNSGGPVFAKIGDEVKVIGIVSKADGRANQGMFWAVPITEVLNMHKKGDRIEVDTVTYRR